MNFSVYKIDYDFYNYHAIIGDNEYIATAYKLAALLQPEMEKQMNEWNKRREDEKMGLGRLYWIIHEYITTWRDFTDSDMHFINLYDREVERIGWILYHAGYNGNCYKLAKYYVTTELLDKEIEAEVKNGITSNNKEN